MELKEAKKIAEICCNVANGYRLEKNENYIPVGIEGDDFEDNRGDACAFSATNTGYFILLGFGYSHDEIVKIFDEVKEDA